MNHFDYRNGVLHAEAVLPNHIRIAGVCCGPTPSPRLYLRANPDVADAVRKGQFKSGCEHYVSFGHLEGRRPLL
jgi:hypothetical protein